MAKRIALITGGMGGLGESISTKMHDAGFHVVVTHSPGNKNAAGWNAEMKAKGYDFHPVPVDVADFESCQKCVATIHAEVGPIDILVNNAGITRDMTFKKMGKADWDIVMETNLDSVFNMTKHVMDGMTDRGWGRVINVSSVNGQKGAFGQTNYSAAKAGMHGFAKALAQEVVKKGVTVNSVSPGYVATEMVRAIRPDVLEKIVAGIPIGRLARPEEIASLVAYLVSDEAGYITGANVPINGGMYMS
jgi:acetoacetyl-CoA reductase